MLKKYNLFLYTLVLLILLGFLVIIISFLPIFILKISFLLFFLILYVLLYLLINKTELSRLKPIVVNVQEKKYLKDLEMAKRVQEGLLSVENPNIKGFKIVKKCVPAEIIGGDFYTFSYNDFQSLNEKTKLPGVIEYLDKKSAFLNIILGDVAGHGVTSALVMALASGLLRELSLSEKSPAIALEKANEILFKYIANSQISYVTAFFVSINLENHKISYAKAGHPAGLLIHNNGNITTLDANGIFLGMFDHEEYEEKQTQLNKGDKLFLYTDGIIEAQNENHQAFGLDRLINVIKNNFEKSSEEIMDFIFNTIKNFTNTQSAKDDQSLIIIELT